MYRLTRDRSDPRDGYGEKDRSIPVTGFSGSPDLHCNKGGIFLLGYDVFATVVAELHVCGGLSVKDSGVSLDDSVLFRHKWQAVVREGGLRYL